MTSAIRITMLSGFIISLAPVEISAIISIKIPVKRKRDILESSSIIFANIGISIKIKTTGVIMVPALTWFLAKMPRSIPMIQLVKERERLDAL